MLWWAAAYVTLLPFVKCCGELLPLEVCFMLGVWFWLRWLPVLGRSDCRLYLSPYDHPTYKDIHNKFSVRYFLNLVLVDEEDRRYFKQQEILLYRKADEPASSQQQ